MTATKLWTYNCLDCVTTAKVYTALQEEMKELGVQNLYDELVQPLTFGVLRMMRRGMYVNLAKLEEMKREYHLRIHGLIDDLRTITNDSLFNPASPDMVRTYLFEKMGLVSTRETATGKESVDELTIKKLAKKNPDPFFDKLLEWRKATKIHSTYLTNLYVSPEDQRVRSRFLVHGTATGRLSSRGPNFQNIPYEVRPIFGAAPGYVLIEADSSQLELRLIAYASNCRRLMEAFENGEDVHTINACAITGKHRDEISKSERDFAKRFIYCQNYGGSPRRISDILFQDVGLVVSVAECEGTLLRLRNAYPEIYAWRDEMLRKAKATRIIPNEFGRKRVTFSRNDDLAGVAFNTPIQSTAADYINFAFVRMDRRGLRIVNQVHDAIVVECHENDINETASIMQLELERPVHIFGRTVVLPCDLKVGASWGGDMYAWQP